MKAIGVFPASREIKLIEHNEPRITQPTQVKLRILEVGVCGTDKEICTFAFGTPPAGSPYLILGHEAVGEVVEVGSAVRTLRPGDLVVPMVRRPCMHAECRACRSGRQDFCFTGDYTEYGIRAMHGFMTEYVVDDEQYMHPVPATLRDVAVLVEPLTIAEKAFSQIWHIQQRLPWRFPDSSPEQPGSFLKAVVLGAGPIGLLGAMGLVTAGFDTYVYSRSPKPNPKAEVVEAIGATYISTETMPVEQFAARIGNIDVVYEAVGAAEVAFAVMQHLGSNAIFVFTGVPDFSATSQVNPDQLMHTMVLKNLVVLGTVNAGSDAFKAAIRDLEVFAKRWPSALRALITGRYGMEDCRHVLLGKPGGIKNVIRIGG